MDSELHPRAGTRAKCPKTSKPGKERGSAAMLPAVRPWEAVPMNLEDSFH